LPAPAAISTAKKEEQKIVCKSFHHCTPGQLSGPGVRDLLKKFPLNPTAAHYILKTGIEMRMETSK
jgi:hypothetical protein